MLLQTSRSLHHTHQSKDSYRINLNDTDNIIISVEGIDVLQPSV